MKKKRNSLFICNCVILSIIIGLMGASCRNSLISELDMIQIEDSITPELSLIKPGEDSSYAETLVLEGEVFDMATQNGIKGKVKSLTCEVVGTDIHEEIPVNPDGSFSYSFVTSGLDETITLKVTALDWNNNSIVISRILHKNAFPFFTVFPGNQAVTLTWEPVPMAQSYTLYYTQDGSEPGESESSVNVIEDIESSYYLDGLENGFLYSFKLKAISEQGPDNTSDIIQAIPLSTLTLAPRVTGAYGRIKVEWPGLNNMPGIPRYIVQRSTTRDSGFSAISGQIEETVYIDTDVVIGQGYFYRVIPADQDNIPSGANYGESSPFPPLASLVRTEETPGLATDIAIKGDYAYIADSAAGLRVISISIENPDNPSIAVSLDTDGNARGIYIWKNYAFIADDGEGLKIIDITTPENPVLKGECTLSGSCCDVFIPESGDFAYVAADSAGIHIVDISDPEHPSLKGTYDTDGEARGVTVDDNYAYIADGKYGLVIATIADKENPDDYSSYDDPGFDFALDVVLADGNIYMADSESGLQIIDVSTPTTPTLSGSFNTDGTATRTALYGDYAFIADAEGGFLIINISDEETGPILAGSYKITGRAIGCATDGEFGYIAYDQNGVYIVNTATPAGLAEAGTLEGMDAKDVVVQGDYAYVADDNVGLIAIDISNPGSPIEAGTFPISGSEKAGGVEVCGYYAFVTGSNLGLKIVDIYDPTDIGDVGSYFKAGTTKVCIWGDYAYLTYWENGGNSGMDILHIADPESPELAGDIFPTASGGHAYHSYITGDTAYIADGLAGLTEVNLTNLSITETCDTPYTAKKVTSDGTYLYIANGQAGLQIIDKDELEIIGSYDTYVANDIELQGDYAYLADEYGGMVIIDISAPTIPVPAGLYKPEISAFVNGIAVIGGYAYVADTTGKLIVLDLFPWD